MIPLGRERPETGQGTVHAPAPIVILGLQAALSGRGPLVVHGGEPQDRQHHNHGQQRVG